MFDVHVDDLRSISYDLQGFVQKDLPASLDSLGQFYYQGDFKGTIYDFAINGRLSSDAGSMRTDLRIAFDRAIPAMPNTMVILRSIHLIWEKCWPIKVLVI